MTAKRDFEELFECLNRFEVRAIVVGAHAEPNRVDLLTAIDGVGFGEAWRGRAAGHFGSVPVFYLGREELKRNKRAAGRAQDLADLELLEG